MTMGEQHVNDLLRPHPGFCDLIEQLLLAPARAGIDQRRLAVEMNQISGGVLWGCQAVTAHLKDFSGDGDRAQHSGIFPRSLLGEF